jgi:glutathione reductase (NADPH)
MAKRRSDGHSMSDYDYDLFTIGAGSGGVRACRIAASHGARVAVAEERYLGGTCVNVGCVPKKLLVYASQYGEELLDAAGYGWTVTGRVFSWQDLIARKNAEISRLNAVYRRLLTNANVDILSARARVVDAHKVEAGGRTVTARYILIATGGWPVVPPVPGAEHAVTSNEAFFLPALPKRVVIVGGGYIGVEFAGIFAGLGARVSVVYRGPLFLRGFDDDIRRTLAEEMHRKGIDLRFGATVASIERTQSAYECRLADGGRIETDLVMYATGRTPKTRGLGLAEAGVALDATGGVRVDDDGRTSVDSIFAVGDCTNRLNLTPVAIREGQAVAETLFGDQGGPADHTLVPTAIFSQPPAATVGLSEAEARARGHAVDIYRTMFRPMKHTMTGREEQTMMKLVVDADTDRVLGVHMVGIDAAEIVQGLAVALRCGARKADFDATVGIHPTAAEEFVTMRTKVA